MGCCKGQGPCSCASKGDCGCQTKKTLTKTRLPSWLHQPLPQGKALVETSTLIKEKKIFTVCEEAKCPNRAHCYANNTATFLALGKECTRACGFCDIDFSKTPKKPDPFEPLQIATACKTLGLKHIVITMVSRDDLEDHGATHIATIITKVREINPGCTVEVLTSDFSGHTECLDIVLEQKPDIFNHNIETVRRLSSRVRHKATYDRSLTMLQYAKQSRKADMIKSGIMVGLGETMDEVFATLTDLASIGCDIVTIGQYLQASKNKLLVKEYVHPLIFKKYEEFGHAKGIKFVYAGPFVRSSFNAEEARLTALTKS